MKIIADYVSLLPHVNERRIMIDAGKGRSRTFTNPTPASLNRLYRWLIDSGLQPDYYRIVNDGTAKIVVWS